MPEGGGSVLLTILETHAFARRREQLLEDDQYRLAQIALAKDPALGTLIPGSGGLRKLRCELPGRGKRGGARVIYYWAVSHEVILLLLIYSKAEKDDLTKEQLAMLAQVVKEEFR
jgi:hypothetical protein